MADVAIVHDIGIQSHIDPRLRWSLCDLEDRINMSKEDSDRRLYRWMDL